MPMMRLLHATTHEFHEFNGQDFPPYAILSHTWGNEEVTFNDLRRQGVLAKTFKAKLGWKKIERCCNQALKDGIDFVWVDTCCIDKSSSAELQEAINSMFRWYELSTECYVFLADLERSHSEDDFQIEGSPVDLYGLKNARWWTRGWTLQELLAPESVRFFDSQWREFGDKVSMRHTIAAISGIGEEILLGTILGARQALDSVSVGQRMSWAARRKTTRVEDTAYCLLGVFDVNMPLLYGEGSKAFQRLQEEIMRASPDQSLLAWCTESPSLWGVSFALAESPADFAQCGTMLAWGAAKPGDKFSMTQRGLSLNLPVALSFDGGNLIYCALNCTVAERVPADGNVRAARVLAVPFLRQQTRADGVHPHVDEYYRLLARTPMWVERTVFDTAPRMEVFLPPYFRHGESTYGRIHINCDLRILPTEYYVAAVFPPEKSENDCVVIRPRSDPPGTSAVLVHFASSSPGIAGFLLVLEFNQSVHQTNSGRRSAFDEPAEDLIQHDSSRPQRPFSHAAVRDNILKVIAAAVECSIDVLSEETQLQDLGVDSLLSLEIAGRLSEIFNVILDSWIFLGSKSIGDVLKRLKFVTRPSYSLLSDTRNRIGRRGRLPTPRFDVEAARYCVVQVGGRFSMADIKSDSFWVGLPFTEINVHRREAEFATLVNGIVVKLLITPEGFSISSSKAAGPEDIQALMHGRLTVGDTRVVPLDSTLLEVRCKTCLAATTPIAARDP